MILVSRNARSFTAVLTLTLAMLAASAAPALADVTAFIGMTPTPHNHSLKGFSVGMGMLVVGFEFEYANIAEDTTEQLAGLKTYSGNVLAQTPVAVAGIQLYGTLGAEGYQERLGDASVTHFGTNIGGGAKINLIGPLRVRVDYRIFHLQGTPINDTYQRFYVGANLKF
jgi:opacity protein-like surface antigen